MLREENLRQLHGDVCKGHPYQSLLHLRKDADLAHDRREDLVSFGIHVNEIRNKKLAKSFKELFVHKRFFVSLADLVALEIE